MQMKVKSNKCVRSELMSTDFCSAEDTSSASIAAAHCCTDAVCWYLSSHADAFRHSSSHRERVMQRISSRCYP